MRMATLARVAFRRYQHMLGQRRQRMSAKRTPIRRWLSAGRRTHRPPRSAFDAGHRSIVAPLAATVAATVAVSISLAIAQRQRRSKPQRQPKRQLGLQAHEPLHHGLQRMALEQVDLSIQLISATDLSASTVHDIRKAIKRLRALHALLQQPLPSRELRHNRRALRNIAQQLAGARDAHVMHATLTDLIQSKPRKLAHRRSVRQLQARLLANSNRLQQQALSNPDTRRAILMQLLDLRSHIAAWQLPKRGRMQLVQPDLLRIYKQGRGRHKRIMRRRGPQTNAMHQWRKSVKDLRYAGEILQRQNAPKRMRPLIRRADSLGELLGQDHDLAVLAQHLRDGAPMWHTSPKTRKLLLKAIAKRRKALRRQSLRQGAKLYRRAPKRFLRRLS
jgi:CHAD domain-containing protein